MFLRKCFAKIQITAVDIDAAMLELAREHFGLRLDEQLKVQIKDGVHFLKEAAESGESFWVLNMFFLFVNKNKKAALHFQE